MNIKDFLPPILLRLARRGLSAPTHTEYESFSRALRECRSDAYQDAELCNVIADKTIVQKERLRQRPFSLRANNAFFLAAIHQHLNLHGARSLTVLDFGGACGDHYFELRRLIPSDVALKWIVVETEQMVRSARDRNLGNGELTFATSIADVRTEIDVVHSSSALQYVPSPYEFLRMLADIQARWMFFNRMMFNEDDRDFVTIQKSLLSANGPGDLPQGYTDRFVMYPHTTMSFTKFDRAIRDQGYEAEWMFLENTGSFQVGNERISGKGLLYSRR